MVSKNQTPTALTLVGHLRVWLRRHWLWVIPLLVMAASVPALILTWDNQYPVPDRPWALGETEVAEPVWTGAWGPALAMAAREEDPLPGRTLIMPRTERRAFGQWFSNLANTQGWYVYDLGTEGFNIVMPVEHVGVFDLMAEDPPAWVLDARVALDVEVALDASWPLEDPPHWVMPDSLYTANTSTGEWKPETTLVAIDVALWSKRDDLAVWVSVALRVTAVYSAIGLVLLGGWRLLDWWMEWRAEKREAQSFPWD